MTVFKTSVIIVSLFKDRFKDLRQFLWRCFDDGIHQVIVVLAFSFQFVHQCFRDFFVNLQHIAEQVTFECIGISEDAVIADGIEDLRNDGGVVRLRVAVIVVLLLQSGINGVEFYFVRAITFRVYLAVLESKMNIDSPLNELLYALLEP